MKQLVKDLKARNFKHSSIAKIKYHFEVYHEVFDLSTPQFQKLDGELFGYEGFII